jgi:hypothetical protein
MPMALWFGKARGDALLAEKKLSVCFNVLVWIPQKSSDG